MKNEKTFSSKDILGTVEAIKGSVFIKRAGSDQFVQLHVGDKIYKGDVLDQQNGQVATFRSVNGAVLSQSQLQQQLQNIQTVLLEDAVVEQVAQEDPEKPLVTRVEPYFQQLVAEEQDDNRQKIAFETTEQVDNVISNQGSHPVYHLGSPTYTALTSVVESDPESNNQFSELSAPVSSMTTADLSMQNFRQLADNLYVDLNSNTIYFYNVASLVPVALYQKNINQTFMDRFGTNVYSSYLLGDFFSELFSAGSPFKMLFDGNFVINLNRLASMNPEYKQTTQNEFIVLDYQTAPITTDTLEYYDVVLTFTQPINLKERHLELTPIITHEGWLKSDAIDIVRNWLPVKPDQTGAAVQWYLRFPKDLFTHEVKTEDQANLQESIDDLKQIQALFSTQTSAQTAEGFVKNYLNRMLELDLNHEQIKTILYERFLNDYIDTTHSNFSNGSYSFVFKDGVTFNLALASIHQLLGIELRLDQSVLNYYNLPSSLGNQMVLVSPLEPIPSGTLLDLQMESDFFERHSVLESPILIETVPGYGKTTTDVFIIDAYNYFSKHLINSTYSPVLSKVELYTAAEELSNNFDENMPMQQWIFDSHNLFENCDLKISLVTRGRGLTAFTIAESFDLNSATSTQVAGVDSFSGDTPIPRSMNATLPTNTAILGGLNDITVGYKTGYVDSVYAPTNLILSSNSSTGAVAATRTQDVALALNQSYAHALASLKQSSEVIAGRQLNIITSPVTSLVYDIVSGQFVRYAANQHPVLKPTETSIKNPIGLSSELVERLTLDSPDAISLLVNVDGKKYFSYDVISQFAEGLSSLNLYLNVDGVNYSKNFTADLFSDRDTFTTAMTSWLNSLGLGYSFVPMGATASYNDYLQTNAFFPATITVDQTEDLKSLNSLLEQIAVDRGYPKGSIYASLWNNDQILITSPIDLASFVFCDRYHQSIRIDDTEQLLDSENQPLMVYSGLVGTGNTAYQLTIYDSSIIPSLFYRHYETLVQGTSQEALDSLVANVHQKLSTAKSFKDYLNGSSTITEETLAKTKKFIESQGLAETKVDQGFSLRLTILEDLLNDDFSTDKNQQYTFTTNAVEAFGGWNIKNIDEKLDLYAIKIISVQSQTDSIIVDGTTIDLTTIDASNPTKDFDDISVTVEYLADNQYKIIKHTLRAASGIGELVVPVIVVDDQVYEQAELVIKHYELSNQSLAALLNSITINFTESQNLSSQNIDNLKLNLEVASLDGETPPFSKMVKLSVQDDELLQSTTWQNNQEQQTDQTFLQSTPLTVLSQSQSIYLTKNSIANKPAYVLRYGDPYTTDLTVNELAILEEATNDILESSIEKSFDSSTGLISFTWDKNFDDYFAIFDSSDQKFYPLSLNNEISLINFGSQGSTSRYVLTGYGKDLQNIMRKISVQEGEYLVDKQLNTFANNENHNYYELTLKDSDGPLLLNYYANNKIYADLYLNSTADILEKDYESAPSFNNLNAMVNPGFIKNFSILPFLFNADARGLIEAVVTVNGKSVEESDYILNGPKDQPVYGSSGDPNEDNPYLVAYKKISTLLNTDDRVTLNNVNSFIYQTEHFEKFDVTNFYNYSSLFFKLAAQYNSLQSTNEPIDSQLLFSGSFYELISDLNYINNQPDIIQITIDNFAFNDAVLAACEAIDDENSSINELETLLKLNNGDSIPTITKYIEQNESGSLITFSSDVDFGQSFVYLESTNSDPQPLGEVLSYNLLNGLYELKGTAEQFLKVYLVSKFTYNSQDGVIQSSAQGLSITLDDSNETISVEQLADIHTNLNFVAYNNGTLINPVSAANNYSAVFSADALKQTSYETLDTLVSARPSGSILSIEKNSEIGVFDYGIVGFSIEHTVFLPLKINSLSASITLDEGDFAINGAIMPSMTLHVDNSNHDAILATIKDRLQDLGSSLGGDPTFDLRFVTIPGSEPNSTNVVYLVLSNNNNLPLTVGFSSFGEAVLGLDPSYINVGISYKQDNEHQSLLIDYSYPEGLRSTATLDGLPFFTTQSSFYTLPSSLNLDLNAPHYVVIESGLPTTQQERDQAASKLLAFFRQIDSGASIDHFTESTIGFIFDAESQISTKLKQLDGLNYQVPLFDIDNQLVGLTIDWNLNQAFAFNIASSITKTDVNNSALSEPGSYIITLKELSGVQEISLYDDQGKLEIELAVTSILPVTLTYLNTADDTFSLNINNRFDYLAIDYFTSTL